MRCGAARRVLSQKPETGGASADLCEWGNYSPPVLWCFWLAGGRSFVAFSACLHFCGLCFNQGLLVDPYFFALYLVSRHSTHGAYNRSLRQKEDVSAGSRTVDVDEV